MSFPPIAYLLNAVLSALNSLRECPLVSLQQPMLALLFRSFREVSVYLVSKAAEVREKGDKYLGGAAGAEGTSTAGAGAGVGVAKKKASKKDAAANAASGGAGCAGGAGGAGAAKKEQMDKLYARAIALELLPHVLVRFDAIFQPSASKAEAKAKACRAKASAAIAAAAAASATGAVSSANSSGVSGSSSSMGSGTAGPGSTNSKAAASQQQQLPCLLRNLYDARDLLDADEVQQLEGTWQVLVEAGLLDAAVLERQYKPQISSSVGKTTPATTATTSAVAAAGVRAIPAAATAANSTATAAPAPASAADTVPHEGATKTAGTADRDTADQAPGAMPGVGKGDGWGADDFGEDF